jgi:hypothetical protein
MMREHRGHRHEQRDASHEQGLSSRELLIPNLTSIAGHDATFLLEPAVSAASVADGPLYTATHAATQQPSLGV